MAKTYGCVGAEESGVDSVAVTTMESLAVAGTGGVGVEAGLRLLAAVQGGGHNGIDGVVSAWNGVLDQVLDLFGGVAVSAVELVESGPNARHLGNHGSLKNRR